jgi:hypothetical protein
MFSIPINPKLTLQQFETFYNFCQEYKDYIYDLYFTCRMPPFIQDAMGDVILSNEFAPIETALHIQESLGIPVSATFNNILIRPSQDTLDLFIQNFQHLYDAGVRSATIPHTHWVATGQIQKHFPELLIKNTILRNVSRANEVAELAKAGFHYINIDRDLMRDRDTLIQIDRVRKQFNVKIALLSNEGCAGNCPMMDEHFQFNNTRIGSSPQYFNDVISRVSCPKWEYTDPATPLKTANLPPWKEDWDELLSYVDVFKMHGRESHTRMFETMDIIKRYANNEPILFNTFDEYLQETNLENKPIAAWREKIKNCKFDCWDCNFCDNVYTAKANQQSHPLIIAVVNELVTSVNYPVTTNIPGLTSPRVQQLLHGLAKHCNNYLEIGSASGATAHAVASSGINTICVDNWSVNIQPQSDAFELPDNTFDLFNKNMIDFKNVTVYNSDLLAVDTLLINNIDLFFYDGPHDYITTANAVKHYTRSLASHAILIFDDANWEEVVAGANAGIDDAGLTVLYSKKMLNSLENSSMWWNGLYIVVVAK